MFYATVITVALIIIVCGIVVYKRALSRSPRSNYTKGNLYDGSILLVKLISLSLNFSYILLSLLDIWVLVNI